MTRQSIAESFDVEQAISKIETEFRGEILLPGDPQYDETRAIWNGMIDRRPAVILRATGTADVVAAVNFARENDLELAIHGGGHNVAGKAVSDGGVMLDLSEMNGVHVDRANQTVRVQGGATLGDVDHETQLFGLATPLGAVSQTGIAGLTLNGGYGHLARQFGLAADSLRSVEIVTADGQVRTASAERHPDLFWAIRGGGGNFGVVTSFEYDLYEVGPEVSTIFKWFRIEDAPIVLERFHEWADSAPREGGTIAFVGYVPELEEYPEEAWGEPAIVLLGSFRGEAAEADDAFAPLVEGLSPIADFSERTTYEALQSVLDEDYPDGMHYYWKSIFLSELTDEVFEVMLRAIETSPSTLSTIDLWQLGGAIAEVPQDATAFWHRDKPFMITFEANWEDAEDDDANVSWAREAFAEIEALEIASGRYGNFPGFAEDPVNIIYGANYHRLVDVKTTYDPENLFRLNQNIVPRTSDTSSADGDESSEEGR